MYFRQFYLGCLSHASYMIGSGSVAAVIDPQRDVTIYLDEAGKHSLQIEHVIETHLHADFVSGHRELAERTGAMVYIGARAEATVHHIPVHDGDELSFGLCKLKFLETPGHSVDSISILVTDLDRSTEPFAVLTGDTLFIGDVGRPDLAAGHSPREMAAMLYHSLHAKLLKLPDGVEVYPAHGAGSLCGRQLSAETASTIGREKATNYALRAGSEEEFIRLMTSELPERPEYFRRDREINRAGAQPLSEMPPLRPVSPRRVAAEQKFGTVVLDVRPAADFAAGHIPGSVHIGLIGQFAAWAAAVLGLDTEIVLVAESGDRVEEARVRLARVGIEKVTGYVAEGIAGWAGEGMPMEHVVQISVNELAALMAADGGVRVVDVRRGMEWEAGHIDGAVLMSLHGLEPRLKELDQGRQIAVHCKSGYRSMIAASLMERAGLRRVANVLGGFDAWRAAALPEVRGGRAAAG